MYKLLRCIYTGLQDRRQTAYSAKEHFSQAEVKYLLFFIIVLSLVVGMAQRISDKSKEIQ